MLDLEAIEYDVKECRREALIRRIAKVCDHASALVSEARDLREQNATLDAEAVKDRDRFALQANLLRITMKERDGLGADAAAMRAAIQAECDKASVHSSGYARDLPDRLGPALDGSAGKELLEWAQKATKIGGKVLGPIKDAVAGYRWEVPEPPEWLK